METAQRSDKRDKEKNQLTRISSILKGYYISANGNFPKRQNDQTTKRLNTMARNISFTIKYWKQNGPKEKGHFDSHEMKNVPDDTSFLEMLDMLNEELINEGKEPFVFDHDCRYLRYVLALYQRYATRKD